MIFQTRPSHKQALGDLRIGSIWGMALKEAFVIPKNASVAASEHFSFGRGAGRRAKGHTVPLCQEAVKLSNTEQSSISPQLGENPSKEAAKKPQLYFWKLVISFWTEEKFFTHNSCHDRRPSEYITPPGKGKGTALTQQLNALLTYSAISAPSLSKTLGFSWQHLTRTQLWGGTGHFGAGESCVRVLLSFGGQLRLLVLRSMHRGCPTEPAQGGWSTRLVNNAANGNIFAFFSRS